MKKDFSTANLGWVAIEISSVALLLAALAVCRSYHTVEAITLDYLGVFAGILSFLVAALISYEIFRVASFDKSVQKQVERNLKNAEYSAGCMALAQLGDALVSTKNYGNAIQALFNALILWNDAPELSELGLEAKEQAISALEGIYDKFYKKAEIHTVFAGDIEQINKMKSIAYKIGSEKLIFLANRFHPSTP